jgi:transposase
MLFVGDDWAEDHHDVEIVDDSGQVLARRRLPEGLDGVTRLHALIGEYTPVEWADLQPDRAAAMVKVGIETDRGPWVAALAATGYEVFAINPMSVARYRERHSTSGAKSDAADAHLLAEIVRVDRAHHRPLAGDTAEGEAIKLTARAHQSLVWDRTRHVLRLRSTLRDFYPAALKAFIDLDAPDTLELLARAPGPDRAARLTKSRIIAALRRAHRRNVETNATELATILGEGQLRQPPAIQVAWQTHSNNGPSPRCADHPAPGATTNNCGPGRSATKQPSDNWRTGSSASCTAASKPTPATTNTPPGPTSQPPPLDVKEPGICRCARVARRHLSSSHRAGETGPLAFRAWT